MHGQDKEKECTNCKFATWFGCRKYNTNDLGLCGKDKKGWESMERPEPDIKR